MHWLADAGLAMLAFIGHFALAVWLFNRLHAVPWPIRLIKVLDKLLILVAAIVVVAYFMRSLWFGQFFDPPPGGASILRADVWNYYTYACCIAGVLVLPLWLIPKLCERVPAALVADETTLVDVVERFGFRPIHGLKTRVLARVPGNQFLQIAVQRKTLRLPRLPAALDGLTIAHLSDLHMTGHLGLEFYEVVLAETNALQPDLIVITGDILEKERCLPWGPPILSRLKARYGTYFILGNHEQRLKDVSPLRAALTSAGLIDLGSRCVMANVRNVEVLLAGNERPWFGVVPDVLSTEYSVLSTRSTPRSTEASFQSRFQNPKSKIQNQDPPFRILLSHTPDQLPWAKANAFDLMLAGHNHGGQIRLPWLGALITPSRYGWRYAGGLYHEPPTLMHVTRGLSGDHCIRLNCPPELALLKLTS